MQDFMRDSLIQIITANAMPIAVGVAAVALLAAALGVVKKLVTAMLAASLNAGEAAARKLTEKPKAVMLGLGVFSLAILGLWAWHTFSAPKVIEKPVIHTVTVKDEAAEAAVVEIREQYGAVESARSDAEARAVAAERRAAALEQARKQDAQARENAEAQVVSLSAQLRELSPPEGDQKALDRLLHEIDTLHADGVALEAAMINAPAIYQEAANQRVNYRNYRKYSHKCSSPYGSISSVDIFYHRRCSVCDQNFQARVKVDAIVERQAVAERQRIADEQKALIAESKRRDDEKAEARRRNAERNRRVPGPSTVVRLNGYDRLTGDVTPRLNSPPPKAPDARFLQQLPTKGER